MGGPDLPDRFDPKELLDFQTCVIIQLGRNKIVSDYWNVFFTFLQNFDVHDDIMKFGDYSQREASFTRLMQLPRGFVTYRNYITRVTPYHFPQLTNSEDMHAMIECLFTLTPLGPQLDELSQRFQAEIQERGVAEDIPRLREIVTRYEPFFKALFKPPPRF